MDTKEDCSNEDKYLLMKPLYEFIQQKKIDKTSKK